MISPAGRNQLLQVASDSIRHGLSHGRPLTVHATDYPEELQPLRASFVTLHHHHELRGCIGILEAMRPLVEDVAYHAWAAAFEDPRFAPLSERELAGLDIHIAILSPPEPLYFQNEADLLRQLRPGSDGLILRDRNRRGTFLPSVWESLPQPRDFWQHLKLKAGLPPDWWSDTLTVERYTTESFGSPIRDQA
jgi:AmmeMemoRadiSam system protein A